MTTCLKESSAHELRLLCRFGSTQFAEPRSYLDPYLNDRLYGEPRKKEDGPAFNKLSGCSRHLGVHRYDLVLSVLPTHM